MKFKPYSPIKDVSTALRGGKHESEKDNSANILEYITSHLNEKFRPESIEELFINSNLELIAYLHFLTCLIRWNLRYSEIILNSNAVVDFIDDVFLLLSKTSLNHFDRVAYIQFRNSVVCGIDSHAVDENLMFKLFPSEDIPELSLNFIYCMEFFETYIKKLGNIDTPSLLFYYDAPEIEDFRLLGLTSLIKN